MFFGFGNIRLAQSNRSPAFGALQRFLFGEEDILDDGLHFYAKITIQCFSGLASGEVQSPFVDEVTKGYFDLVKRYLREVPTESLETFAKLSYHVQRFSILKREKTLSPYLIAI